MGAVKGVYPDTALFLEEGRYETKHDIWIFGIKALGETNYDSTVTVKQDGNVIVDNVQIAFFKKNSYVGTPVKKIPAGTRFEVNFSENTEFGLLALLGTKEPMGVRKSSRLFIKSFLFTNLHIETISIPAHQKFHIVDILAAKVTNDGGIYTTVDSVQELIDTARFSMSVDGKDVFETPVHPFVLSEKNEYFNLYARDKIVMRASGLDVNPLLICVIGEYLENDMAEESI